MKPDGEAYDLSQEFLKKVAEMGLREFIAKMEEALERKTGWGKNEVKALMQKILADETLDQTEASEADESHATKT